MVRRPAREPPKPSVDWKDRARIAACVERNVSVFRRLARKTSVEVVDGAIEALWKSVKAPTGDLERLLANLEQLPEATDETPEGERQEYMAHLAVSIVVYALEFVRSGNRQRFDWVLSVAQSLRANLDALSVADPAVRPSDQPSANPLANGERAAQKETDQLLRLANGPSPDLLATLRERSRALGESPAASIPLVARRWGWKL